MFFEHIKTLCYTFTNSDTWHNNDELTPAEATVKFKHCFDIDVCLTGAGFHFDVKRDGTVAL